ncbi:MAG: hypothetical protein JXQ83_03180, partial [Candidatus Glassbacteria bacterium]|nr:hypothetical protein [Candidatus Glassbacteria bacterium]
MRDTFTHGLLRPGLLITASLLVVLTAFSPGRLGAFPDTLEVTLGEVIGHALKASPRILAAESGVDQAQGMKTASLAGNLPHLSVSEVFNRGNDPVFAFGSKLRQARF